MWLNVTQNEFFWGTWFSRWMFWSFLSELWYFALFNPSLWDLGRKTFADSRDQPQWQLHYGLLLRSLADLLNSAPPLLRLFRLENNIWKQFKCKLVVKFQPKLDCLNCEKALYFTTYAPTLSPGIQPDRPPLLDHLIPIWSWCYKTFLEEIWKI